MVIHKRLTSGYVYNTICFSLRVWFVKSVFAGRLLVMDTNNDDL